MGGPTAKRWELRCRGRSACRLHGSGFFAAWPMLAACIALYLLRDLDTPWALGKTPAAVTPVQPSP